MGSLQVDDLENPLEVVVHYLLIREMVGLSHLNGVLMVSVLVCMITHWTRPMVSHNVRLSSSHELTKLLHCVVSQLWGNIKLKLKLTVVLTYSWDHKLIIYSLSGSLLMENDSNRYS